MKLKNPWDLPAAPRPADAWWAAVAACALAGLGIARLTLELNPHLSQRFFDTLLVHLWLMAGYGALGAVAGILGAAFVAAVRRRVRHPAPRWTLAAATVAGLALTPLVYFLLLPGVGLASGFLTRVLTARGPGQALGAAGLIVAPAALGTLLGLGLAQAARRLGVTVRLLVGALWILTAATLVFVIGPAPAAEGEPPPVDMPEQMATAEGPPPPRVVLLCIDGADLDDIIQPMIDDGELPSFARFLREGTWGPLETFEPTLSPVVWTTVITGKAPEVHGIHHFLHFRLPGVRQAIYHFPQHTGLNFRVFPLLERIPGMPVLRTPYTSNMRRAAALWNIVGQRYGVGTYRWLISWPAEKLNGFSVAGSIAWADFADDAWLEVKKSLRGHRTEPPRLSRTLERRPKREVPREVIEAYVGAGYEIDRRDPRLNPILRFHFDPTSHELPALIDRFGVRFAAASFYTVDPFHHLFNSYRRQGGAFAGAIAERYRTTDARLGELLAALGEETQVIVVSDHGFDFEESHHTHAPPGVFFALGPAFDAGRRVEGLSVYDVAPLVLHLLDMPLPDDMPGTQTGTYRSALSRAFLDTHPVRRIATYETPDDSADHESIESPQDDAIRDVLKTLGYVE